MPREEMGNEKISLSVSFLRSRENTDEVIMGSVSALISVIRDTTSSMRVLW